MKYFLFFIFLLLNFGLYGQDTETKYTISGVVYDADIDIPLEFATVTFQCNKTNNFFGAVTNKDGAFKIVIKPGTYTFTVEFLSFEPFTVKNYRVDQDIDLGKITLRQNSEVLNEVELQTGKQVMEYRFDKKIYHVGRDISNQGGSAITALENLPTVQIDEKGSATIRGNTAKILINGKPFGGQEALAMIPSNSIQKVEVMTASAKYGADAAGGIINIILKKGKGQGVSGSVEAHAGLPDNDGGSLFISHNSEKINVYSSLSFNHLIRKKNTDLLQEYYNSDADFSGYMQQDRYDERQKNSVLFNIGSEFKIDKKNSISSSFLYTSGNKDYDSDLTLNDYTPQDIRYKSTTRDVFDATDDSYFEALINYTTVFTGDNHNLSFDFKYEGSESNNYTDIVNYESGSSTKYNQKSNKDQKLNTILGQADYKMPIKKNGMLETGVSGRFRRYLNNFLFSTLDPITLIFQPISGFKNDVSYDEDVYGAYAKYALQNEKFSFSVALRTEYTRTEVFELNQPESTKNNYFDFFPSLELSYMFENQGMLNLYASRYIDRPDIKMLNPFTSIADNRFILTGNPYLKPFYTNSVIVEYYIPFEKLNITTSAFYTGSTDYTRFIIENTGDQTPDNFDIFIRKPVNDGNYDRIGMDLSLTYMPSRNLRLFSYVSPYYFTIYNTFEQNYDYSDFVFYGNFVGDYRFNNGLRFQLNYSVQTPMRTALTTLRTIQYLNAAVSLNVLGKKGTVTFRANDLLQTRTYRYESFEANTFTDKTWRFDSQYLLSFTYRFNKPKRRNTHNRNKDIDKEVFEIDEDIK